jgi:hypothetical protein
MLFRKASKCLQFIIKRRYVTLQPLLNTEFCPAPILMQPKTHSVPQCNATLNLAFRSENPLRHAIPFIRSSLDAKRIADAEYVFNFLEQRDLNQCFLMVMGIDVVNYFLDSYASMDGFTKEDLNNIKMWISRIYKYSLNPNARTFAHLIRIHTKERDLSKLRTIPFVQYCINSAKELNILENDIFANIEGACASQEKDEIEIEPETDNFNIKYINFALQDLSSNEVNKLSTEDLYRLQETLERNAFISEFERLKDERENRTSRNGDCDFGAASDILRYIVRNVERDIDEKLRTVAFGDWDIYKPIMSGLKPSELALIAVCAFGKGVTVEMRSDGSEYYGFDKLESSNFEDGPVYSVPFASLCYNIGEILQNEIYAKRLRKAKARNASYAKQVNRIITSQRLLENDFRKRHREILGEDLTRFSWDTALLGKIGEMLASIVLLNCEVPGSYFASYG